MLQIIRPIINNILFKNRHRKSENDFIRERILSFPMMITLLLQKGSRSLQLALNEFVHIKLPNITVTNGAYTKARKKFKHTAFIELNQLAVVDVMYGDGDFKTYKGHRVLGVDGSKILLPGSQDVIDEFGTIAYSNGGQHKHKIEGERAYGLASVMYDVLNNIAIDALLDKAKAYEIDLAAEHLKKTQANDLFIGDRNYPSFRMLGEIKKNSSEFLIRCSKSSFFVARKMLNGGGADSQIVQLQVHPSKIKEIRKLGLPEIMTVRFVRVLLDTGEYEVLVTSLIDEAQYPTIDFKELYWLRWGVEGFYDLLKNRLNLENFSGLSAESVKQDFHASVFLTGVETLLTVDAEATLEQKQVKNPQQVNKAVSFHTIKHQAFEILLGDEDNTDRLLERLTKLFLQNPTVVRQDRNPPRKKASSRKSLDFHKRRRKVCY